MDGRQFDALTRSVTGSSRRSVIKTLASGALVGALGLATVRTADAARCGRKGDKCQGNPDCCNGFTCVNSGGRGGRCRRSS